jgi:hypothetical protein
MPEPIDPDKSFLGVGLHNYPTLDLIFGRWNSNGLEVIYSLYCGYFILLVIYY